MEVIYDRGKFSEEPTPDLLLLGDGQLGRMIIQASRRFRLPGHAAPVLGVIGLDSNSSAGQVADIFYVGNVNTPADLDYPVARAKAVGLDTEHVDSKYLRRSHHPALLFPPDLLPYTQNKLAQHQLLRKHGIPMPDFIDPIQGFDDLESAVRRLGGKAVLQTGNAAYDGKGNAVILSEADIQVAWDKLGQKGLLYLEEFVDFDAEMAVQIVRGRQGRNNRVYPPTTSIHHDGILYLAEASAYLDPTAKDSAIKLAQLVSKKLPGAGLLTVEMFLKDGRAYVNEFCVGRPHNSHHWTEGGAKESQFGQTNRMAYGLDIGSTQFRDGVTQATMLNLLGAKSAGKEVEGVDEIEQKTGTRIIIYGKDSREGRKLGEIRYAYLGSEGVNDRSEGLERVLEAQELLNNANDNRFKVSPI